MPVPERIQLQRVKGWRMPPNTVKVDRSTFWGNPFKVGKPSAGDLLTFATAEEAVSAFAKLPESDKRMQLMREELTGKNLACWCPIGTPCHAEVLLRLANDEGTEHG